MPSQIIYAAPTPGRYQHFPSLDGGPGATELGPMRVEALALQDAVDLARPGDTVQLLPGVYDQPVVLYRKGRAGAPLTLRGCGGATLDGRRNAVRPRAIQEIDARGFAFFRLVGCNDIRLEQLTVQNCWPTAIHIEDCRDIRCANISFDGATYGIFAKGLDTRRILVEHCSWQQDPTIWSGVNWSEVHDPPHPRRAFDGDFFRSWRIGGDVVIRRNYISHAFNGVHLFAAPDDDPSTVSRNVWIYQNTFAFIRDNAVEAEHAAWNWFVFANVILNCHVWLAFENCLGGYWYAFGNRGWFTGRPGPAGDCNIGGGIIKASNNKRLNSALYAYFNNSFYVRGPYLKKGRLRRFRHFNNAIEFAEARFHAEGLVIDGRNPFAGGGPDPRCDGSLDPPKGFTKDWGEFDIRFANDIVLHPDYPDGIRRAGWPVEGRGADPGFGSGRSGDFMLTPASPCRGAGHRENLALADGGEWQLPSGLNVGALDNAGKPYDLRGLNGPDLPAWVDALAVA
jgi:hypothetical protein